MKPVWLSLMAAFLAFAPATVAAAQDSGNASVTADDDDDDDDDDDTDNAEREQLLKTIATLKNENLSLKKDLKQKENVKTCLFLLFLP